MYGYCCFVANSQKQRAYSNLNIPDLTLVTPSEPLTFFSAHSISKVARP